MEGSFGEFGGEEKLAEVRAPEVGSPCLVGGDDLGSYVRRFVESLKGFAVIFGLSVLRISLLVDV